MSLQNYLLCILYAILLIAHSYTLSQKDFYRGLISVFSFALFTQTISTMLFTLQHTVTNYYYAYFSKIITSSMVVTKSIYKIHYFSQIIHITSIDFFILFLLIVAKGWPITRRHMPSKYVFFIFWFMCLVADLTTFCWMYIDNETDNLSSNVQINSTAAATIATIDNSNLTNVTQQLRMPMIETNSSTLATIMTTTNTPTLILRFVIMLYFLLELRTTMILEQEQKKLEFYLHFGAISMVWFVHSLIVYIISLRVEIWQSKLISGFSSAANFLAFAVTTCLLWPTSSRSYLFKQRTRNIDSNNRSLDDDYYDVEGLRGANSIADDQYDGLEMRDLTKK